MKRARVVSAASPALAALAALAVVAAVPAVSHADPKRVSRRAAASGRPTFDPAVIYKVPRGDGPSTGPHDAPVTIVVWSDYACGFCNRVQVPLDQLQRLYPDQIRLVHRTLPLDDDNLVAAEAALAAHAQGKFRAMSDRLYGVQGKIDRAGIELIARELGLDMIRFRADLDTGTYRPQIQADIADARTLGIDGTPMFFINGRPVNGNQPLKTFVDLVDDELRRARDHHGTYDELVAEGHPTADGPSSLERERFVLDPTTVYQIGRASCRERV